jgi:octaprenyl-diphosphate synthase
LANASVELESACATYGQALGTAFQVIDDVLDYAGDSKIMGKNIGDDLREGKATLPLIAAMQRGSTNDQATVRRAIETGDVSMLDVVVAIVEKTGSLEVARICAHQEAQRAIDAVRQLPAGLHTDCLVDLASQLLGRKH